MAEVEKTNRLLEKYKGIICCPYCKGELNFLAKGRLSCGAECRSKFRVLDSGALVFLTDDKLNKYNQSHQQGVNWMKSFFKRVPRLYYILWYIFCPVLLSGKRPAYVERFFGKEAVLLNLGSGPRRIGKRFINVDVAAFPEVDIVAEAENLPFRDNSVDAVVNESLLEHVEDHKQIIDELHRVLKPGGIVYISVPFLTPYHASPDDYTRWTRSGLRALFKDYEIIEEGVDAGPWSAFLVFFAYWLGVVFSFGSRRLAPFLGLFFMTVLGPLKVFDFIFARLPGADAVAAQLYFIARKKRNKKKALFRMVR